MKLAAPLALLASILIVASPLAGQERDGTIARPGQLRIDLSGEYLRVDSRFGDGVDPWGVNGSLNRGRLTAVTEPANRFDDFLAATGGPAGQATGDSLTLGHLSLDGVVAVRYLPIRVGLGLLPRIEVGVSLPVVRTQRLVRRLDITGGNLGLNPDVAENSGALSGLGEAGVRMGGATLLPVAGSAAGELLQARALAATGQTLELPEAPLTAESISSNFDLERASYDAGRWDLGDLEIDARVQILSSFSGQYPVATEEGASYRLVGFGGYRFAAPFTIETPNAATVPTGSVIGYSGPHGGAVADLWVGRLWATFGAKGFWLSRDEEKVVPPAEIELRPGSGLAMDAYLGEGIDAWFVPRVRITREISFGASLEGRFLGGAADPGSADPGGRSHISGGLSLRFSSLPGMAAGEDMRPVDATLGFKAPIRGTDGEQRIGNVYAQVTLLPTLWGRQRGGAATAQRVAPEPVAP